MPNLNLEQHSYIQFNNDGTTDCVRPYELGKERFDLKTKMIPILLST